MIIFMGKSHIFYQTIVDYMKKCVTLLQTITKVTFLLTINIKNQANEKKISDTLTPHVVCHHEHAGIDGERYGR